MKDEERKAGLWLQNEISTAATKLLDEMEADCLLDICKAVSIAGDVQQELTAKMLAVINDDVMPDIGEKRYAWNMANGINSLLLTALLAMLADKNTQYGDDDILIDQYKNHLRNICRSAEPSMVRCVD